VEKNTALHLVISAKVNVVFVCMCTLRRHISITVPDRCMVTMDHL